MSLHLTAASSKVRRKAGKTCFSNSHLESSPYTRIYGSGIDPIDCNDNPEPCNVRIYGVSIGKMSKVNDLQLFDEWTDPRQFTLLCYM